MKVDEFLARPAAPPGGGGAAAGGGDDFLQVLKQANVGLAAPPEGNAPPSIVLPAPPAPLADLTAEDLLACLLFSDGGLVEVNGAVAVETADAFSGSFPILAEGEPAAAPFGAIDMLPELPLGEPPADALPAELLDVELPALPEEPVVPAVELTADPEPAAAAEAVGAALDDGAAGAPESDRTVSRHEGPPAASAVFAEEMAPVEEAATDPESAGGSDHGDDSTFDHLEPAVGLVKDGGGETAEGRGPRELDLHSDALERLGEMVTNQMSRGGGRLSVTLHPPELGEMQVEVLVRGERVGVRFHVDNTPAQGVLLREMPGLRELLEGRGFAVDRAEVYLRNENGQNESRQSDGSREGSSWGAGGGSADAGAAEMVGGSDGAGRSRTGRTHALDIEV